MKRKTQAVSLFADIRSSLPICASLSAIVMMGVLFFVGIVSASQGIRDTMDAYFTRVHYQAAQIASADGFTDDDIQRLSSLDGVTRAEGGFALDAYLHTDRDRRVVSVHTLQTQMNDAELVSGRMPEKDDECAIEEALAGEGYAVGDVLELDFDSSPLARALSARRWTVTGVVRHPASAVYVEDRRGVSTLGGGCVQSFLFVPLGAFQSIVGDRYGVLYATGADTAHAYTQQALDAYQALKRDIGRLDESWTVLMRPDTILYQSMRIGSDNLSRTGLTFAFIFVGVAAIVCYTSFSRLIQDRRAIVGIQKANGLRLSELLRHYLLYAAFCAVPGVVLGVLAGWAVLQPILVKSYMTNLTVGAHSYAFKAVEAAAASAAALGVMMLSALVAVVRLLKQPAAKLLREQGGDNDGSARLGARLARRGVSMRRSVLVLNLRSDINRLVTTVLGVAGCTALIIIGLTMKLGLEKIPDVQYQQIQKNDTILTLAAGADTEEWQALLASQGVAHALPLHAYACGFRHGQDYNVASAVVTDADDISADLALIDPYTGKPVALPQNGVLLSVRTCEYYGISAGDTLRLTEADGTAYDVTVGGIIDNYMDHLIVMRAAYYRTVSGKAFSPNQFYLRLDGMPDGALTATAAARDDYVSYTSAQYKRAQFDSLAASMNAIVALMIGLSAALAAVVLYQLIQLTLNKRSAELAVMYANGFTGRELRGYIARENRVMTLLGLLAGVGVGVVMADRLMGTLESDTVRVLHGANLTACLLGVGLTALFATVIEQLLLRRWKPRQTFLTKMRQWQE